MVGKSSALQGVLGRMRLLFAPIIVIFSPCNANGGLVCSACVNRRGIGTIQHASCTAACSRAHAELAGHNYTLQLLNAIQIQTRIAHTHTQLQSYK